MRKKLTKTSRDLKRNRIKLIKTIVQKKTSKEKVKYIFFLMRYFALFEHSMLFIFVY